VTYHDEAANGHQVVENVFFPWELGVAHLQLPQILVRPIRIKDESDLGAAEQERRHDPPYLRRESEQNVWSEVDVVVARKACEVDGERDEDDACGKCPVGMESARCMTPIVGQTALTLPWAGPPNMHPSTLPS
jgi:hypothetical protein